MNEELAFGSEISPHIRWRDLLSQITRTTVAGAVASLLLAALPTRADLVEVTTLNEIYDYIAASEYHIRWFDEAGTLKSANRNQNLRFTYYDDGFAAEPRDFGEGNEKPWDYQIQLLGYGKDPAVQNGSTGGQWSHRDNKARSVADRIEVEYINEPGGMRQNFLIKQKPPGNQPLELTFRVRMSNLSFAVRDNLVEFSMADGTVVARYEDLHVFDATESEIPAAMVRKNPEQFVILVDDSNATYPILIDPLNVSVKVYINDQAGAKFSYSLARIDWSGHDYSGVLVGAPYFDTGLYANAGKAFAYYGYPLPNSPTWEKEGDQAYGYFGWSVASPGDMNQSGYVGVLVGAPYYDSGGYTDNGKVFLFYGTSSGIDTTAGWTATVSESNAHAGYSVSAAGDVDFSSSSTLAFGAPDYDYGGSSDAGYVSVYKSSSSGPAFYSSSIGNGGSRLGFSLASAGDLNNDSYEDLIAGAPEYNSSGAKGAVQVYFSTGSGYNVSTIIGQNAGDKFGHSVAGPGDVDGDGYGDILVGAPYFANGQTGEGKAYLFTASYYGLSSPYWTDEGNQTAAHLGWAVAGDPGFGDVSLDGTPDFAVSAPDHDNSTYTDNGQVRFYVGGSSPSWNTSVNGLFNSAQTGTGLAFITAIYRTPGLAVGTPTGVNASDDGGTVQIWRWQN